MNVNLLLNKIRKSPVIAGELPLSLHIGLPHLEYRNDRLILSFSPYSERVTGDKYERHYSSYRIEFVYPSCHLLSFIAPENGNEDEGYRLWKLAWIADEGQRLMNDVYGELDHVLSLYDTYNRSSRTVVEEYEKSYALLEASFADASEEKSKK